MTALLAAPGAGAAESKIFRVDTREAVLKGTLEGVRVGPLGSLELASRIERLAALAEPFVFTAAGARDGWVVGTGSSGKVLRVDAGGEVSELFAAAEPQIFAVLVDADGAVLAGSSPEGKVYRAVDGGEPQVVFAPEESYIWALARDRKGRLLVATGLQGRIYRVDEAGKAEVLYESRDSHVRALAALADGSVLAGTAGQGLILRIAPDGKVETLHDAVHPEVLAFAPAPDGVVYAAVLASEASQVDLSSQKPAKAGETADESVTVTVVAQGDTTLGSRSASFTGPRSAVLAISPDGKVEQVAELQDETVHSLLWHGDSLWIGTGQEGRLYRLNDRQLSLETRLDEQQLAAVVAGGAGVAVVTANASAIHRLHDERAPVGVYTSSVLDAGQVARFGSFQWEGSLPADTDVELAFRSGLSANPDATWTEWECAGCGAALTCRDGEAGCQGRRQEVPLGELAHGRYVQWRSSLTGRGAASPRLQTAELSYRQENLRPRVEKLEVLAPGEILVPNNFNPTSQTFEPWSPNREGIFTSLRDDTSASSDGRLKTLWKKGYRTVRWTAKDDNEDELLYRLDFRRERPGGRDGDGAGEWLPMVSELDDDHYSFDATVLPDGVYRFRLTASDQAVHPDAEALNEEEVSEPVVIDHTAPVLVAKSRRDGRIEVEVRDASSPLRDAAYSVDAGEWQPATTADTLLDGRHEVIRVPAPAGARLLLLRLTDAAFNVVTLDLLSDP